MIKKLSYQQRLRYVFIGAGIFALVLYNMSISNTLDLAFENQALEAQIAANQDAPAKLSTLKLKLATLKQLIGNEPNITVDVHQQLLQLITEQIEGKNLMLTDFPQPFVLSDKGYLTKTALASLEGNFVDLLKVIYYLEHHYKIGKVVAVNFKTTRALRNRKRKLTTVIYIQNVKTEHHEANS